MMSIRRNLPATSVVRRLLLASLLTALTLGGCDCAIGEYNANFDGNIPPDLGPVDGGPDASDAGDAGDVMVVVPDASGACGNGRLEGMELGEKCDPNYSVGSIPELRCLCPSDNDPCTDDVWVDDPVLGQCYGECRHLVRSGQNITHCNDGNDCTVDVQIGGSAANCDVQCRNDPPSTTDTTCNGFDDDCNGLVDDGFVNTTTSCGAGICVATGQRSCSQGQVVDTCSPGTPLPSDTTCNGVDDDCNGVVDDGFTPYVTNCGVGACSSTGIATCGAGGVISDSCASTMPGADDSNCNGADEDCDGVADDDYVSTVTTCGRGVCATSGVATCTNGRVVDSCTPLAATGTDTNCDGIDEDCDGVPDDGYASTLTSCGQGVCMAAGLTSCVNGAVQNSCTPGTPTGTDQTCNGIDEDCDGVADDAYAPTSVTCGLGVCQSSGVEFCVMGAIQSSCTPRSPTGTDQNCNGADEDCDGVADDGFVSTLMTCGVGVCTSSGLTSCTGGVQSNSCIPGAPTGTDQNCNGMDEDCDGVADDAFVPYLTSCGQGVCAASGVATCSGGTLNNSCVPRTATGTDQNCNGLDEDCDGTADDGYTPASTTCGTGACAASGTTSCVGGTVQNSCVPGAATGTDANCNGIDEDCDGTADDGYAPTATTCGVGSCTSSGVLSCVGGMTQNSCTMGSSGGADDNCNGIDEDCDGVADDAFVPSATSCGVGVCAATGFTSCMNGALRNSCTPGTATGTDQNCNGLDEDCDGVADDGYVAVATTCGLGVCGASGFTSCVGGMVRDSCVAGTATGTDQNCNGLDEDCDGSTDDGYSPVATACGTGVCARTGMTTCVLGVVQDSCLPGAATGTDQNCNGSDEDCDGVADDGYAPVATSCGQGVCAAAGITSCSGGTVGNSCVPGTATGTDQNCNGLDEDCDGVPDDGYVPMSTTCGQGVCAASGVTSCSFGTVLNSCIPGIATGTDSNCNGVDEDCDGVRDDGYVAALTSCGQGVCSATGVTSCTNGTVYDSCTPGMATGTDANCNGIDEDCDGTRDDGFVPTVTSCGQGVCAATGVTSCVAGTQQNSCMAGTPLGPDTNCNGLDEDCDGVPDDGYVPQVTNCGQGVCARSGVTSCVAGVVLNSCMPGPTTGADTNCNGVDEDCDGVPDDGFVSMPTSCGQGVCADTGFTSCVGGVTQDSCVVGMPTGTDTNCNGVDEDCDGTRDDGYVAVVTSCGQGVCTRAGVTSCVSGVVQNSCVAGSPTGTDANCNGQDENCNGVNDDGYVPLATSCGQGVCARSGVTSCVSGAEQNSCMAGTPTGTDANCNGLDENCNGAADDAYVPMATSCGQGVCANTGFTSCVGGVTQNSCSPRAPTGTDTNCNAVDEDCDGVADDGYTPTSTSCGMGACTATGLLTCSGGVQVNSCTSGMSGGPDTNCNGIDEDCDGTPDDEYVPVPTTCGTGVCGATGVTSCVQGMLANSCMAGSPTGMDTNCNGIDEDCDGVADDGYVPMATSCGQGVCVRAGVTSCVGGMVQNSCVPGAATGTDANCNGQDEDCDGTNDDGYVSTSTTCGQGVCAATGTRQCVNGTVTDSCTVGSPTGTDANCNGVDEDCDGTKDDGYVPRSTTCGSGVCASSGVTSCSNGMEQNSCVAGMPTGADTNCNGQDENCNGVNDDGYVNSSITCGLGVCLRSGTRQCIGGSVTDSCTPGSMTGTDADCDGIDQDCDGMADDGYGSYLSTCGVGECASTGIRNCQMGMVRDTCMAGTPAANDSCNGLDDNCNGTADEGNPGSGMSCSTGNLGVCSAGTTTCSSGSIVCVQSVAASAEVCDALDNDCDGVINDGNPGGGNMCSTGQLGVCGPGTTECLSSDTSLRCKRNVNPSTEICNGADDDCNGATDSGSTLSAPDGIGNTCSAAGVRTVSVAPTGSGTVNGYVDGVGGDDYITVTFTGVAGPGNYYHPVISITPTSSYVFSIQNGDSTCTNSPYGCGGSNRTTFEMTYPANPNACQSYGQCIDNFARQTTFVVRVRRNPSSPTPNCTGYTLTVSNQ